MARRGQELAGRFNRVLHALEQRAERERQEREQRLAEGREARRELLDDLGAFAEAVGHLQVQAKSHDQGLTLRYRDRFLHFVPQGEGERLRVEFSGAEGEEHRLYREPELGNRWVWVSKRGNREDRLPLFDAGLEALVVRALSLPTPADMPAPEPAAPAPSLDDLLPGGSGKRDL